MSGPAVEEALDALRRVQRTLASTLWDRMPAADLSIRQIKALHFVGSCGELSVGALGERLGVKLPAASIQADHLVQAGLLERQDDPEDRRRVILRLTGKGEEVVDSRREIGAVMREWMEAMPETDLRALTRGLRRLAEVASAGGGPAAPAHDPIAAGD